MRRGAATASCSVCAGTRPFGAPSEDVGWGIHGKSPQVFFDLSTQKPWVWDVTLGKGTVRQLLDKECQGFRKFRKSGFPGSLVVTAEETRPSRSWVGGEILTTATAFGISSV